MTLQQIERRCERDPAGEFRECQLLDTDAVDGKEQCLFAVIYESNAERAGQSLQCLHTPFAIVVDKGPRNRGNVLYAGDWMRWPAADGTSEIVVGNGSRCCDPRACPNE